MFKGENFTNFCDIYLLHWPTYGHEWSDLSQTWYGARHDETLQFDSSVNDLDCHTRLQVYGKARTYAAILL